MIHHQATLITWGDHCSVHSVPSNLIHTGVQGTNITEAHTTNVNDTLKRNNKTAVKKDRIKMFYEEN
jgi:hypothetical protein